MSSHSSTSASTVLHSAAHQPQPWHSFADNGQRKYSGYPPLRLSIPAHASAACQPQQPQQQPSQTTASLPLHLFLTLHELFNGPRFACLFCTLLLASPGVASLSRHSLLLHLLLLLSLFLASTPWSPLATGHAILKNFPALLPPSRAPASRAFPLLSNK